MSTKFFQWAAVGLISLSLTACGGSTKPGNDANAPADSAATPKAEAKFPALRNNGYFLMWYNPQKAMYKSTDGRTWEKSGDTKGWPISLSSGTDGHLYASINGDRPTVTSSLDGLSWTDVKPNDKNPKAKPRTYAIGAGNKDQVYALSSKGDFQASVDGGVTWKEMTRVAPKEANGSGGGFKGYVALSPDASKILIQGWYFEGAIFAQSEDGGKTWTNIPAPTERNEAAGIGYSTLGIYFASPEGELFTSPDLGQTWISAQPTKLIAPKSQSPFYYRAFASDGANIVIGVEASSTGTDATNPWPGCTFYSKDGGKTFETLALPWDKDPTPTVSDEYVYITFVPASH